MKVLIVDDEQVERETMQAILGRNFVQIELKQAPNGRVAAEMAEEFQPDVVLMDIQMPGMNGFEAIEKMNTKNRHIKFIMVTAYATFDYAHSAMKLGVVDYIVKPSKVKNIVETVGKVLKQVEDEKKEMSKKRYNEDTVMSLFETDIVTQLLFDHVHEVHIDQLVRLLDIKITQESFVMTLLVPLGSEVDYPSIREKVRRTEGALIGALSGRQIPIIVFRKQDQKFQRQASSLVREILSLAQPPDSQWFIGIGNVYRSLEQIRQSYQESLIATKDTTLSQSYCYYSEVREELPSLDDKKVKQQEEQIFRLIHDGKWEELHAEMSNLLIGSEKDGSSLLRTQQRLTEFVWIISQILNDMGVELDSYLYTFTATDFRQLRSETNYLLQRIEHAYKAHSLNLEGDTIQRIKQYVIRHADQDISLQTISKEVGLSPIYISKIFKEHLGINYINFLTECRIEKAKKLMRDPEKSMKEITFEVGYHDPNYFSKVFKKMCQISPTEYRKKLLTI
ncbi:response regulator [Alkalihalobacillus sp. MEB130]|uniref:response regulator n=1 Tax=Alkalihalobacillus sp. MEB130 TaxID=2976704 RepID=UPI0028E08A1F|nr:response regulator [Alkalihalobacillus sp. MEB130]MDT8860707.1 response regulator [Alkalihalobacillus sp. MEB130]